MSLPGTRKMRRVKDRWIRLAPSWNAPSQSVIFVSRQADNLRQGGLSAGKQDSCTMMPIARGLSGRRPHDRWCRALGKYFRGSDQEGFLNE